MLNKLAQLAESEFAIVLRIAAITFLCGMNGLLTLGTVIAEFPETRSSALSDEHRFSVLETKVDSLKESVDELQSRKMIELLMLTGLLGERGIQLIRRKAGPQYKDKY